MPIAVTALVMCNASSMNCRLSRESGRWADAYAFGAGLATLPIIGTIVRV